MILPTDAPPTEPAPPRRRLHARAHRRRRAPPLPRLRRADRDALGARGHRRARRSSSAPSRCSASAATPPFSNNLDVEVLQALHGRAPSLATGVKRAKPDTLVFTIQGDGDMVNEGLQEVMHAAARGENDHLHHAEQRRVRRDRRPHDRHHRARPAHQEHARRPQRRRPRLPDPDGDLLAELEGAAYVARGAVNNAGNVAAPSG